MSLVDGLLSNPTCLLILENRSLTSQQCADSLKVTGLNVSSASVKRARIAIFGPQKSSFYGGRTHRGDFEPNSTHFVAGLPQTPKTPLKPPETPPTSTFTEQHEKQGDNWTISIPRTCIKTLDELLEHCQVDKAIWSVDRFVVNKWETASFTDGVATVEPLFQVKAWLKRNRVIADAKAEIAAMMDDFKTCISMTPRPARLVPQTKISAPPDQCCLLEVSIPDIHMGKRAWHEETGNDYDLEIAERIHDEALDDLLQKTSAYPVSRVLYVVGNDLLNADNLHDTTTKGTLQQVDGRYQHVFRTTRRMLVRAIERMTDIAHVDVVVCPGNHDRQSAFCMGEALGGWFHNHPLVSIDNSAALRTYYEYGQNMLCFTHGSEEKLADLPLIMAAESPHMWGRTKWREVHVGHFHTSRVNEHKGVRVRILPSLCGTDDWHKMQGYVGNIRSAEAYVWSFSDGLVGTHTFNLKGE